ncbi:MAG: type IV secretory system conjugative DNA transfer family protein [Ruminococcaceae bacterium]|nr:type IV secretory system conjugative DNA transfer family protein [Oscillospiraceae bacterium]
MEYKFGKYQQINQETRWATTDELKHSGTYVNLHDDTYPGAGIPLMSDGHEAYVDSSDTHTLIFGSTGSKKTRLFCMPMLNFFVKAGESFVVTDPKGELYARSEGIARANGYDTVVINFREVGKGDMWNPLLLPYTLYHNGKRDEAVSMLNDFVRCIASPQFESSNDVFWPEMASSLALANLLLLMECASPDEVNVASLASLCTSASSETLKKLSVNMSMDNIAGLNYKNIFTSAEKTLQSIMVSLFGMIRIFVTQNNLTNMLSGNTINISDFGRKKTAVYLIIPDEKSTYHFLVTTFIKQAYEILIAEAQKEKTRQLPVRVNFVLDEFCNLPTIPDMPSMISAARSRNMRYFLVAQSLHQLKSRYGEDADTIKGNCDNWVFLTSKELDLLEEISLLCGSYYTANGLNRRLISVSELQRLDKSKGETLIMHCRQYPIITEIADIDSYPMFKGYEAYPLQHYEIPKAKMFDLNAFYKDVVNEVRPLPF